MTRSSWGAARHRSKLWRRTARNLVFRRRPYFAHLAVTHRCNLRCRFCQIAREQIEEVGLEDMQRIIDRLDRMGVAVLSFSSGGEPLLRRDCVDIVNYAARKGLYVKLTSNGTMPRDRYDALLDSDIREIAISLDGIRGNDLPYSHVGPRILETIRYLNDRLPQGKSLTLNVTVNRDNYDHVHEIAEFCRREFSKARQWFNPVTVGQGKFRVEGQEKVRADFFPRTKTLTTLEPAFFKRACADYYANDRYDWKCLAGELFFAIKPNGDFWLCQDFSADPPMNILSADFEERYRHADFRLREGCQGCTYSCYMFTQKAFELRHWKDLGVMWWKVNTAPDEPCRVTGIERGALAALAHFAYSRLRRARRARPGPVGASGSGWQEAPSPLSPMSLDFQESERCEHCPRRND